MYSQKVLQLIADVWVLLIIVDKGIMCNQCILGANIDGIINLPVHITNFPCRMEQTLFLKKRFFFFRKGGSNLADQFEVN